MSPRLTFRPPSSPCALIAKSSKLAPNRIKACGHLSYGNLQRRDIDHGSVALVSFLIAGGDAPECFELAEEVFHEVSPAVGVEVAVDLLLPVRFGRDYRYRASCVEFSSQPVGVERLVSKEPIEFDILDERFNSNEIVALARQENETNQVSQCIDQRDDLCGQSAARTSDRLTMSPPLAPVPCWWTRTIVPSIMAYSKSGSPDNCSNKRSKTPFTAHLRNRRKLEFQLPKVAGKSRHGAPVPASHKTASRNLRLSAAERPLSPTLPGSNGLTRSHCSSLNPCRSNLALPSPVLNPILPKKGIP